MALSISSSQLLLKPKTHLHLSSSTQQSNLFHHRLPISYKFNYCNTSLKLMHSSPAIISCASQVDTNASPNTAVGRIGEVKRVTKETTVHVKINLDGSGIADSSTSIPFLDHMLDQLASHGLFDVYVRAMGDIHIDDHHTNEDVALAIGTALLQALDDRKGINRFGNFSAPLDEALVHVSLLKMKEWGQEYNPLKVVSHGDKQQIPLSPFRYSHSLERNKLSVTQSKHLRAFDHSYPAMGRTLEALGVISNAVLLDLSGRPYLRYDVEIPTERVGTYDTQLVEHFFQSLVNTSGMTLHIQKVAYIRSPLSHFWAEALEALGNDVLVDGWEMYISRRKGAGKNSHHIIEATFKAFARALRQATEYDLRRAGTVPSSKGVLSRS